VLQVAVDGVPVVAVMRIFIYFLIRPGFTHLSYPQQTT